MVNAQLLFLYIQKRFCPKKEFAASGDGRPPPGSRGDPKSSSIALKRKVSWYFADFPPPKPAGQLAGELILSSACHPPAGTPK